MDRLIVLGVDRVDASLWGYQNNPDGKTIVPIWTVRGFMSLDISDLADIIVSPAASASGTFNQMLAQVQAARSNQITAKANETVPKATGKRILVVEYDMQKMVDMFKGLGLAPQEAFQRAVEEWGVVVKYAQQMQVQDDDRMVIDSSMVLSINDYEYNAHYVDGILFVKKDI